MLAAGSAVTGEVEKLLGLSFKHFCTCVALPQGDFVEFLHTTPGERQKILSRLLGLNVYDRIARLAGDLATRQNQRAETLTGQLDSYMDVTEETVRVLESRVTDLRLVDTRVRAALPVLDKASARRAEVAGRSPHSNSSGCCSPLSKLPAGVVELDEEQRAAAQGQYDQARTALRAEPDRHELETIRSQLG
ncbi:hypothetical protein [Actinophytocola sp.]|uniref:hypothetical protein n=1 Tax=Actinophytocola sp. TaxID=1872138 RepID=UPI00389A2A24